MEPECLTGGAAEEVGGKNSFVNMEKTQTHLNVDRNGLKEEHEDGSGRGLKSAASGGISFGQEQAWRMKAGWQVVSLNIKF